MDPAFSGPHTPAFLYLGGGGADHLKCSYSQHSALETANQEAAAFVTADILGPAWQEMECHLDFISVCSILLRINTNIIINECPLSQHCFNII
jgi:hypothetical protein